MKLHIKVPKWGSFECNYDIETVQSILSSQMPAIINHNSDVTSHKQELCLLKKTVSELSNKMISFETKFKSQDREIAELKNKNSYIENKFQQVDYYPKIINTNTVITQNQNNNNLKEIDFTQRQQTNVVSLYNPETQKNSEEYIKLFGKPKKTRLNDKEFYLDYQNYIRKRLHDKNNIKDWSSRMMHIANQDTVINVRDFIESYFNTKFSYDTKNKQD